MPSRGRKIAAKQAKLSQKRHKVKSNSLTQISPTLEDQSPDNSLGEPITQYQPRVPISHSQEAAIKSRRRIGGNPITSKMPSINKELKRISLVSALILIVMLSAVIFNPGG